MSRRPAETRRKLRIASELVGEDVVPGAEPVSAACSRRTAEPPRCYDCGMGESASRRLPELVACATRSFAERLRARWGEQLVAVRVFGSFARGGAHEESDVDVLVVLAHLDRTSWREVIDLGAEVGLEFGLWLSPTLFDLSTWERWVRQERPLAVDVARDGIAL